MNHEKKEKGTRHIIFMVLACVVPLTIIFMLPFFGISGKWTTTGSIVLMIFLHVLIMKDHFKGEKK